MIFRAINMNVFTARFVDCHFNESIFPLLGGEMVTQNEPKEINEMHHHYMHMILAPVNVNLKFKGSLNCRILQMKYLMYSLILKR